MKINYCRILNKNHWTCFNECMCSGGYWEHFSKANLPGWEIWCSQDLGVYRIYEGNQILVEEALNLLEGRIARNKQLQ